MSLRTFSPLVIFALNVQKRPRVLTYLDAVVPGAEPLLPGHFIPSQAGQVINLGAVFPVAHQELAVLVTPETNVLPDFLDLPLLPQLLFLFLLLLLTLTLATHFLHNILLHPGRLLTNEARTVFGTA